MDERWEVRTRRANSGQFTFCFIRQRRDYAKDTFRNSIHQPSRLQVVTRDSKITPVGLHPRRLSRARQLSDTWASRPGRCYGKLHFTEYNETYQIKGNKISGTRSTHKVRNAHKILAWKRKGWLHLEKNSRIVEDNIKMNLVESGVTDKPHEEKTQA